MKYKNYFVLVIVITLSVAIFVASDVTAQSQGGSFPLSPGQTWVAPGPNYLVVGNIVVNGAAVYDSTPYREDFTLPQSGDEIFAEWGGIVFTPPVEQNVLDMARDAIFHGCGGGGCNSVWINFLTPDPGSYVIHYPIYALVVADNGTSLEVTVHPDPSFYQFDNLTTRHIHNSEVMFGDSLPIVAEKAGCGEHHFAVSWTFLDGNGQMYGGTPYDTYIKWCETFLPMIALN